MLQLSIKLLIDSPQIDHGAFVDRDRRPWNYCYSIDVTLKILFKLIVNNFVVLVWCDMTKKLKCRK